MTSDSMTTLAVLPFLDVSDESVVDIFFFPCTGPVFGRELKFYAR